MPVSSYLLIPFCALRNLRLSIGKVMCVGVLILLQFHINGQSKQQVDSLRQVIASAPSDSLTNAAYRALMIHYIRYTKSDSALYWGDQLLEFAERNDYAPAIITANYYKAYYHYIKGDYKQSIAHTKIVVDKALELNEKKAALEGYSRIVINFNVAEQYDSALFYLEKQQNFAEDFEDYTALSQVHISRAHIYEGVGSYDLAVKSYLIADSIQAIQTNQNHYLRGIALHNTALLYFQDVKNIEKATEYANYAAEQYQLNETSSASKNDQIQSLNILFARIERHKENFQVADSIVSEAVDFFRSRNHTRKLAEAVAIKGDVLVSLRNFSSAENYLQEALQLYKRINTPSAIVSTHNQLSTLYEKSGRISKSINERKTGLTIPQSDMMRAQSLKKLALLLQTNGQNKEALDTLLSHIALQDSLDAVTLDTRFLDIETRYQTSQKESQIAKLEADRLRQSARNQRIVFGIISLLVLASGIALYLWYSHRQKERLNRQLQEVDRLKSKFFSNISHELRTPLALIKGPVDTLLASDKLASTEKQQLSIVQRNTKRLIRLVNDLLELSRIEAGSRKLKVQKVNPDDHLRTIFSNFESAAISNQQEYIYEVVDHAEKAYYEPQMIETIVYNLISNALKYSPSGAQIEAGATADNNNLVITVSNTGETIPSEELSKIFERFYRVDDQSIHEEGVGVGLALVKELVNTHKGNISVESTDEDGTTFTVNIPISKNSYTQKEIIDQPFVPAENDENAAILISDETNTSSEAPIMLIVEDNSDMRGFLTSTFAEDYQIRTAENGKEGLRLASEIIPDVIISDMMMPVMNGAEMCQAIKHDVSLSHIPIIVLTAKAEEETKLSTLTIGVDDYIAKPFSVDEIAIKVKNLLSLRKELQLRYSTSDYDTKKELSTNPSDEKFWNELDAVLHDHLTDETYSIESFAQDMAMSRMQLHRKLKALTGKSASAFLRTERLKKAKELLSTKGWRVSEVAYECGFSSPFYFSKCFKEEYGVSPKDFIQ